MAFKRTLTLGEFSISRHHDGAHAIDVKRKHASARKSASCSVARNLNLISSVLRNRSFMRPGVGGGWGEYNSKRLDLLVSLVSLVPLLLSVVFISCKHGPPSLA